MWLLQCWRIQNIHMSKESISIFTFLFSIISLQYYSSFWSVPVEHGDQLMYTFRQACVLYDVRDVKGVFNRADPHLCVFIWIWRHVKMSLVSWSSWWEESKTDRLGLFIWQNNGLLLSVHWLSVSSSMWLQCSCVFKCIKIHWYNFIFSERGLFVEGNVLYLLSFLFL